MKTQKYLVTIEMPDGDMIGPGWIKDIIQAACDVEDVGRHKVSVKEIKAEYIRKDAVLELLQNRNKEINGTSKALFRSQELQEIYWRIKEL